jgi:uncharacterized protein
MPLADPSPATGPVAPAERLLTLDVLRGMALLGVLVANACFWFSGMFLRWTTFRLELVRPTLDSAAFHLVTVLVNGRAIAMLTFLFGVGFAMQMQRAEARGADPAPLFRRRMAVLLGFGLCHAVLLWYGDILTVYALLGSALLLFRRRADRTLLAWAAALLVGVPLAIAVLMTLAGGGSASGGAVAAAAARGSETLDAFRSLDPRRIIPENLYWLRLGYLGAAAILSFPAVLGCFLLGLWAGRRQLLARTSAYTAGFRRVAVWGLAVGLTTGAAWDLLRVTVARRADPPGWLPLLLGLLHLLSVVPLAAGYVSATVLLLERPAWRTRLAVFAPVGRMALTNYLSQTVICLLVFYAGGLVGRVGVAAALAIALAVFAVQAAWSPWWLARYHFGPAEWLWRSLAYGRAQPMRIRAPSARPSLAA